MNRFGQVGIAMGALGIMVALMGLFPQLTGVEATIGIGVVQIILMLVGIGMLILGGLIYVKFTFYYGVQSNLVQQIGIRLALTGLLFAALTSLSDILGFGSHLRSENSDIFLGTLQLFGIMMSFAISFAGVMLYSVAGHPQMSEEAPDEPEPENSE